MKKVLLMCFMLIIAFTMVGCDNENEKEKADRELLDMEMEDNQNNNSNNSNNLNILDEIEIKNIKQSYVEMYLKDDASIDDIEIETYYGKYNNNEVIMIKELNKGDTGVETIIIIDGVEFKYNFSNREILLWDGKQFYNLLEAYEATIISKDDLEKIKKIHNK